MDDVGCLNVTGPGTFYSSSTSFIPSIEIASDDAGEVPHITPRSQHQLSTPKPFSDRHLLVAASRYDIPLRSTDGSPHP